MHGLDPSKASVVPDIGFDLPSLQGESIDEHFHRIGTEAAEPWSSLAKELCSHKLPPPPALWKHVAGWTKYSSDTDPEPVACPDEQALVFDVETLPRYSQYPIIAVAASTNAWYCWVSPWLLGLSDSPDHLVPLGDPDTPKVVIGHNVAYDRARVMEEYSFNATRTRFIDTMALHIAVKGMSSGQRPVWMKYNKQRDEQERLSSADQPSDPDEDLSTRLSLEDDVDREEFADTRWEKITSANSLLHVARLHCGIKMDKTVRDDLLTTTPQEVVNALGRYIEYCARDVQTTHAVFRSVLPKFLSSCPSPVSFAGALTMGSGFLPVDQSWLEYLQNSEETFGRLDASIKAKLADLAEDARRKMHDESWRDDQWLSQLDWMPKKPKRRRLTVHREVPIVVRPFRN
jgi:DNA polymerase gamma 1